MKKEHATDMINRKKMQNQIANTTKNQETQHHIVMKTLINKKWMNQMMMTIH